MLARLYYEAHVTVEQSVAIEWEKFAFQARQIGWRASKFDVDEVDDMSGKWFLSWRGEDLEETLNWVERMVLHLTEKLGMKVLRWKVEDTLYDSKHGDKLNALRGLSEELER